MPTLAAYPMHRPQVHGHRGCRGLYPENTLPAFLHALQLGVDVLELDVVLSADQQVVVAHEPWLSSKLGLSLTGQLIDPHLERQLNLYELSYDTIRQSIIGTLPHPDFPEQHRLATYRPLLTEVLQATEAACRQQGRPLVGYSIEIKSSPETEGQFHPSPAVFTATVLACIPTALLARVTLLSFDSRILQAAHLLAPQLRLCLLVENPFTAVTVFNTLGFIPTTLGPEAQLLSEDLLAELKQLYTTLEIVPWTVNDFADLIRIISWPVTGITTDYPNRMLQLL